MRVRPKRPARHSKTQYFIAAFVPALIILFSITGFVWASDEVMVVIDGHSRAIETQSENVGAALADAGIHLDESDLVTPARDARVRAGMTIIVRHAVPVTLSLGGQNLDLDVVGESVADALVAAGIDPAANPGVTPSLATALRPGMRIAVPDVFVRVVQEEAVVEPKIHQTSDPSLRRGTKRVVTRGTPGRELRVYRVVVAGGLETTRVLSVSRLITKPVPQVVAVGTAGPRKPARSLLSFVKRPPKDGKRMRVVATGYSAAQPDLDDRTATGRLARHGVIAVDPRVIPMGTRVYVPGYGYAVAADTGGAIHGRRIDLCFDTVAEARSWGRRSVTIIALD